MLIVGKEYARILDHLPTSYLFIDDGELIDRLTFPKRRKITVLDFDTHSLNPLKDMSYRKAREFIQILDATFPEGQNTLTKKNSNFLILKALLDNPKHLETLIAPSREPAQIDASQKIETLLFSPLLRKFLTRPTNFSLTGTIVARLNRAELGDFDCFVITNLLMSAYKGHIVIPDYGTYACPFHLSFIRQDRLIAGVHVLEELPEALQRAFLLSGITPAHCTFADADVLANADGILQGTNDYRDFIFQAMR